MSIRKRTWETAKGERVAWLVDYVDQDGKRHARQFKTKGDATSFANRTGVEIENNEHVAINRHSMTVERVGALWLETCRARKLKEMTVRGYEQHLRLHINPILGKTKVARLGVSEVRSFLHRLQEQGRSAPVIASVRVSLGCLLTEALERKFATRNPVRELSKRRSVGTVSARHEERIEIGVDVPTNEEIGAIIHALADNPFRPHILASIFLGIRISELRGLAWRNVDFAAKRVAITQRADAKKTIGSPKSKAGKRSIPMFPMLTNALKEWKLRSTGDLVFPGPEGEPLGIEVIVRRGWWRAQIDAGVVNGKLPKYTGIHSARHWFISWCANPASRGGRGMDWKEVQEIAGHASLAITMGTYAHLLPRDADDNAMEQAEAALLGLVPRNINATKPGFSQ